MPKYLVRITEDGEQYNIRSGGSSYSAGTGISITNDTINHSNSVIAQSTQSIRPIAIDSEGHISSYGSPVSIPTKTSELTNDSGFITSAPVQSVNGQTGNVTIAVPTKTSDLTNDSGYLTLATLPIYDGAVV